MHRDQPVVTESAEELKALLKQEANRHKRQRLHALYLFATDQVTTRQQAAQLLGVHRETLGRWMSIYASGGLAALLDLYVPKGKSPALPQAVIADLEQQLHQPAGFASFETMRVWLFETHAVTISAKTLQKFVHRRFGARPKVARPSHIKKPKAVSEFKTTIVERLRAVIPSTNTLPVQLFAQDESRLGLQTIRRRRITARGVKPIGSAQHDYANCWVYGCIAPQSGERFFLLLPTLTSDQMQLFIDEFAKAHPNSFNIVLLDNAGAHVAKGLRLPANVAFVFQPPASPELNPGERVWQDLKGQLAWMTFADLEALQQEVVEKLCAYDARTLQSLTSYPYLLEAIHVVCS